MLKSAIDATKLLGYSLVNFQSRYYAIPKRKLIRKEFFVYSPKMKSRYKGNPFPRLKVILLEDVDNIGMKGDIVEVKRGRGRLDLIPNKLAIYATNENMEKMGIDPNKQEASPSVPQNVVKHLKKHIIHLETPSPENFHHLTRDQWMITRHDIADYFMRMSGLYVPIHCMNICECDDNVIRSVGEYTVEITINQTVTVPVPIHVKERPEISDL